MNIVVGYFMTIVSSQNLKIEIFFSPTQYTPMAHFLHPVVTNYFKGWGLSAKLGKHSAILGKLGTALQAYTLDPCNKFPPNQINQTPALWQKKIEVDLIVLKLMSHVVAGGD